MENQQMGMPAEMAAPAPNPEEMAVYDRMRQEISPQEFSNEMLASASQVDPQAVAEFTEELQSLDVSPEELDALNDLVDEVLASPEQYDQLRQKYLSQGLPDDILPEQFDPYFFAALNMAVDQMIAAPTGVQAFAEGGIAELKPIAKAIASYGRNGDTMLAHITPAEARMLRRRGGSGTINPHTGLPEFFLKKAFKSIGNAVKKFANSTVGRIVLPIALGFFLGPAAASFMGVGSAAGVAAVSGFVGGAGSTLLAGGNLKDALKAGAIGGVTAGAVGGATQGFNTAYAGPTTIGGQVDAFKGMLPGAPAPVPTGEVAGMAPTAPTAPPVDAAAAPATTPGGAPVDPLGDFIQQNEAARAAASAPAGGQPSLVDQTKGFLKENISPSGIKEAATPAAQKAGSDAVSELLKRIPTATPAMQETAYQTAFKAAMPGIMGTYGPIAATGLGIMGLAGGFQSKSGPGITAEDRKGPTERIREEGSQKKYFVQGLPGVKYDQFGEPLYGEASPFTTQDPYRSTNFALPATIGGIQGVAPPMAVYNTPSGSIGSRQVAQPYNTASMYSNLMASQRYADGGQVQYFDDGGAAGGPNDSIDIGPPVTVAAPVTVAKTPEQIAAEEAAAAKAAADAAALRETQRLARENVARQKQMRRAQGSGQMYANINAGLAALAPETNPMDTADTGFGARNRAARTAELQRTYAPMLQGQRFAMDQQAGIAASGQLPSDVSMYSGQDKAGLYRGLARQGMTDAQIRAAAENRYGMQTDADWQGLQRAVADPTLYTQRPGMQQPPITTMPAIPPAPGEVFHFGIDQYGRDARSGFGTAPPPSGAATRFMNMGGIAGLAQGGYPRRTGQISGPGTEKSDDIPAMLSDGEFVMTAKAVRGAGKGSRRAGAKQMYKLMHQLEKNSERG